MYDMRTLTTLWSQTAVPYRAHYVPFAPHVLAGTQPKEPREE